VLLFTEPEGYHFGAANGLGLAVWRNTATGDDDDDDDDDVDGGGDDNHRHTESSADMDKIAFGFMTWQPNATILHYTSKSTGDMLDIKLVSFICSNFFDISVISLMCDFVYLRHNTISDRDLRLAQMTHRAHWRLLVIVGYIC